MGSVHALPVATEPWASKKQIAQQALRTFAHLGGAAHVSTGMPHRNTPHRLPLFRLPRWTPGCAPREVLGSRTD